MRRTAIGLAGLILLPIALYSGWKAYTRIMTIRLSAPPAYSLELCADAKAREGRSVTVALGDSLTRGNMSHSYVADARARLGDGHLVLNAGRNGLKIAGLAASLDPVIACKPDQVTLLIGTNDALQKASFPADWQAEAETFRRILKRLREETQARIAVFSLPFAGDNPDDALNRRAHALSAVLIEIARAEGATVLPLRTRQRALLRGREQAGSAARPPECDSIGEARGQMADIIPLVTQRGRTVDYDQLAASRGHFLVIDCVHLSATGAGPATDLLVSFVDETQDARP